MGGENILISEVALRYPLLWALLKHKGLHCSAKDVVGSFVSLPDAAIEGKLEVNYKKTSKLSGSLKRIIMTYEWHA